MDNSDLSATRFFFELGPNQILDAVETFGYRCTGRCLALNSMENRVYEVEIEGDSFRTPSDRFRVVKFYRPGRWSAEQIGEEHQFLSDLIEYEIPVVAPLKSKDGGTLQRVKDIDIFYSVFPKIGGRIYNELNEDELLRIGRLLGRLHNVGATKPAQHRLALTPESYGTNNLSTLEELDVLPDSISARYKEVVTAICKISSELFKKVPTQRIHGDCHLGNLLWCDTSPFWVDFDDMVSGPKVQDLWLLTPNRDSESEYHRELLLEGYEQFSKFDRSSLRLIEPLRALRMIRFSAWIAVRWKDPAFPRAFPTFGTERYWGEELLGLVDILSIIQKF